MFANPEYHGRRQLVFFHSRFEKWDAALTQGKLLKKSSFDEMWTIAKLKDGTPNSVTMASDGFWKIFTATPSSSTKARGRASIRALTDM